MSGPHPDELRAEYDIVTANKRLARERDEARAEVAALKAVAHAAWHVMDDSGEIEDEDGLYMHDAVQHDRLSAALDALEAAGWDPHLEDHE